MTLSNASQAAKELLNRRTNDQQLGRFEPSIRPTNMDESFAIQAEFIAQSGDNIGGWKCLLPLAEDKLIAAPILASTVNNIATVSGACPIISDKGLARIEPEITFVLGQDLPARVEGYSEQEIDAAVASCHMALELMKCRFSDASEADFYEKLADCLVNQGLFIGPEIDKALAYQAGTMAIKVSQNGKTTDYAGVHPNKLPYKPLHWLINYMSKRGVSFNKGQAIITGSYAGIIEVDLNAECDIEYVGLGKYQIAFQAK